MAIAFPIIDPVAIEMGPLMIRWYSLAYVMGLVIGWRWMLRLADRPGMPVRRIDADDFLLWATLAVILGGRIGYVLFYRPGFYLDNPMEILAVWRGGMSFHGGLLGVLLAIVAFSRKRKLPWLALADMVCAVAPVGLFFGRVANFINGELFGRVTDVPWGMVFPRGGPMPRHPSQLYEAGLEGIALLVLTVLLVYRFGALQRRGLVAGCFMIGYGLSRFAVEFVREPDAQLGAVLAGATMGQLLSLPLIAFGLWLVHRSRQPG